MSTTSQADPKVLKTDQQEDTTALSQHEADLHNTGVPLLTGQTSTSSQTAHAGRAPRAPPAEQERAPAVDAVHKFEGQEPEERQHYQNLWKDPNTTTECKLNAADDAEALPHHGFLAGDL